MFAVFCLKCKCVFVVHPHFEFILADTGMLTRNTKEILFNVMSKRYGNLHFPKKEKDAIFLFHADIFVPQYV